MAKEWGARSRDMEGGRKGKGRGREDKRKGLLSAGVTTGDRGMESWREVWGRTWNVSSEQKLMIFPRRRGTMCWPAACESSQTDLRFTFRTCRRQRSNSSNDNNGMSGILQVVRRAVRGKRG